MKPVTRTALAAMVAVLLFASAVYLYQLNDISFWEDESWLAIAISDSPLDVWQFATTRGVHPPLYFYLAYVLEPLISDTELALRWLGGLVTLIGIALTYRLGYRLSGDYRVGIVAALIAVSTIYLIYLTRLARHYTLFYTLSTLVYWLYWRWQAHPKRRLLLWLMLAQAALLYTHYFGAFVAVTIAAHAVLTRHPFKRHSLELIAALIGSGLLFLPWLPSIWAQLNGDLGEGIYYAAVTLPSIFTNYTDRLTNANPWIGLAFLLLGCVALWREKRGSLALLLLLNIVGTFALIVLVNQTLFQWYIGRNMLYTLPLMAVFYSIGVVHLWRTLAGKLMTGLVLVAFVGWGGLAYDSFFPGTPDWRNIMRQLADEATMDDTFVIRGEPYSTDYYLRRYLGQRVDLIPMADWLAEPTFSERIWLIDSGQAVREEAIALIPDEMTQTRRLVRLPIVAELYQQPPQEDAATANFDNQLLLGYTGGTITARAAETLTLNLWWQPLRTPDFNYSASVQIWSDEAIITQVDGNFDSGRLDAQVLPVGVWTPDLRTLTIPPDTAAGDYDLRVTVYDWRDGNRLSVTPDAPDQLTTVTTITVQPD